jgi:hypothetical protein
MTAESINRIPDHALSEALTASEVSTPLAASIDPKVSTTPSSNRFAFTLDGICVSHQVTRPWNSTPRSRRTDMVKPANKRRLNPLPSLAAAADLGGPLVGKIEPDLFHCAQ